MEEEREVRIRMGSIGLGEERGGGGNGEFKEEVRGSDEVHIRERDESKEDSDGQGSTVQVVRERGVCKPETDIYPR